MLLSASQNRTQYRLGAVEKADRVVLNGNQAIVAGALAAGCGFFAGYPITPASDIMEALAKELPQVGGTFLQAEDEMAALAAVLGASYGGVRAMTATSGPGFSLMTELIGLSSMAELPAVIVDSQRSGPSTGMPTKMEQSDLSFALNAGHGDSPRIVIAPANIGDCYNLMILAFNMAERYQMPVLFLTDQIIVGTCREYRAQCLPKTSLAEAYTATARICWCWSDILTLCLYRHRCFANPYPWRRRTSVYRDWVGARRAWTS